MPLEDVSRTKNVLLRCLSDSRSQLVEWRTRVHPPKCIPPRHCFLAFLPRDHYHRLLPSSLSPRCRYRMNFRENQDFIERSRSTRPLRMSSVSFFEWRVIQFPFEGWISRAANDIILHGGRSDIKSHLRESPLSRHIFNVPLRLQWFSFSRDIIRER